MRREDGDLSGRGYFPTKHVAINHIVVIVIRRLGEEEDGGWVLKILLF